MSELCLPISPVKIAVIQYDPQVGLDNRDGNLKHGLALARRAAREGANLIVLPELANTGYTFQSRAEAYAHAQTLQEGASLQAWADFAQEQQVYLAAGFAERDGLKLYDSAVCSGLRGCLGITARPTCGIRKSCGSPPATWASQSSKRPSGV
ncbi:hypothetical protein BR1R5_00020 [Pseudomonas sp. BR1R-5]|nr:hypothetical protein BR1R5_00020 [Pseudomonas sp. BR1R-5]